MTWHEAMPLEFRDAIVTGDARVLADRIPPESVDLIFTDPVYDRIDDYRWLADTAARVLRPEGHLLVWQGVKWMPETAAVLNKALVYRWTFILTHLNATIGTIKGDIYSHWTPLLWFSKTQSRLVRRLRDVKDVPLLSGTNENHQWHKSVKAIVYWLSGFSEPERIVLDPFTGGGTVPACCVMLDRHYVAFEIDPEVAERARERVRNTQPPLAGLVVEEQMPLEVADVAR